MRARVWLPFFRIADQISLSFFDLDKDILKPLPSGSHFYVGDPHAYTSFIGFSADYRIASVGRCIFEVDFSAPAVINIARNRIGNIVVDDYKFFLRSLSEKLFAQSRSEILKSRYRYLSAAVLGWSIPTESTSVCWFIDEEGKLKLKDISDGFTESHDRYGETRVAVEDTLILPLRMHDYGAVLPTETFGGGQLSFSPPYRSLFLRWEKSLDWGVPCLVAFPEAWKNISIISTNFRLMVNKDCELAKRIDFVQEPQAKLEDQLKDAIKSTRAAASFVYQTLLRSKNFWESIFDNHRGEYDAIMQALKDSGIEKVLGWAWEDMFDMYTIVLTMDGIQVTLNPLVHSELKFGRDLKITFD